VSKTSTATCAVPATVSITLIIPRYVDIVQFFQTNIAADLVSEDVIPLLKVDAIKYLYTFRSLIGHSYWQSAFPLVITHLTSSHYVVYTYASIAVERILYLSEISKTPIISRDDVVKSAPEILRHLFGLIQQEKVSEKIQENEFLMRCIMRVLIMIRTSAASEIDMLLHSFVSITEEVQKNPSNPRFYYYLFEAMGAVVRFATASAPEKIHAALYSAFSNVLSNDVQEFTPYAFQLFAAALEADPSKSVPNTYQNLVTPILLPPPWESKGNVPALVRFLSAVVIRDADDIVRTARLEPILGIFQKLVSSRSIETYAFELLDAVLVGIPKSALNAYFVPILQIMLSRLSNSKTENFAQQFTRFYHFFSATDDLGTDFFVSLADQVQNEYAHPLPLAIVGAKSFPVSFGQYTPPSSSRRLRSLRVLLTAKPP
jgi:exportin-2 (importin alpha re-exporter)